MKIIEKGRAMFYNKDKKKRVTPPAQRAKDTRKDPRGAGVSQGARCLNTQ